MDREFKKKILEQLVKQEYTTKIKDAICKELNKISSVLLNQKNYDDIDYNLSLLKIIAFREKEVSLDLLDNFFNRMQSDIELCYEKNQLYSREEFLGVYNTETLSIRAWEILNHIRYIDVTKVIKLLFKYSLSKSRKISDKIKEILKNISEYNIHLLENAGLGIHFLIVEELKKLSSDNKVKYSSEVAIICDNLLSCETRGTSSNYDSFTFHRGSMNASDNFKKIRSDTISILKEIYDLLSDSELDGKSKRIVEIVSSLEKACWQSSHPSKNDEEYYKLFNLVLENAKEVVEFYISKIDDAEYRIVLGMDGDMARLHHRSFGIDSNITKNTDVINTNKELISLIEQFKSKVNQDKEFLIYRDLVSGWGYLSIYRSYYGHDENTEQNEIDKIDNKITNYAKSIDEHNLDEWLDRIFKVIRDYDGGEQPFRAFNLLNKIAKLNPKLGVRILGEREKEISELYKEGFYNSVILSILSGLVEEKEEEGKTQIILYLEQDKYFKECILALGYSKTDLDIELMKDMLKKAEEKIDSEKAESSILFVFVKSIESYIKPFDRDLKKIITDKIKDFLLNVIKLLTFHKNGQLTDDIFYGSLISKLIENINTKDEVQIILDNLLFDKRIDYRCEEILAQITKKYPDKVIEFFDKRLEMEAKDKNYDAIPYEFFNKSLKAELVDNAKLLFAMARKRFDSDSYLFEFRAAKLFQVAFTNFEESFEKELIKLVKTEDEKDFDFVIRTLRSYTSMNDYGEIQRLHNVCKEIIKSPLYDEGKELYTELAIILTNSGIMSGKYGVAEKHERKVREITLWKDDPNDKVKRFYDKFSESELKYAQSERKRADEQEELRKYEYGE